MPQGDNRAVIFVGISAWGFFDQIFCPLSGLFLICLNHTCCNSQANHRKKSYNFYAGKKYQEVDETFDAVYATHE
jgi:hypothetical protein